MACPSRVSKIGEINDEIAELLQRQSAGPQVISTKDLKLSGS